MPPPMASASIFFSPSQERSARIRVNNFEKNGGGSSTENNMPVWISRIRLQMATTDSNNAEKDDDFQQEICVFVSEEVLSIVSPIFKQKFLGKDAESECEPILRLLPNMKIDDFIEFLTFIFQYNGEKDITEDDVHSILELSTKFEVGFLTKKCDKFFVAKNFSIMSKEALLEHLNLFVKYQLIEATMLIIPYVAKMDMDTLQTFRKRQICIPAGHGVWVAIYEAKANSQGDESVHRGMYVRLSQQVCAVCKSYQSVLRCQACNQVLCTNCLSRRCEGLHTCRKPSDCICDFTFDSATVKTSFATKVEYENGATSTDLSIFLTRNDERNFCFKFKENSADDGEDLNENSDEGAGPLVWVSKEFLSVVSPVFRAMLFGDFSESQKSSDRGGDQPIDLRGKNVDEFLEFLECLFPYANRKEIDDSNVRFILDLADQYGVDCLLQRCSNFLAGIIPKICDEEEIFEYSSLFVQYRLLNPMKLLIPRLAALSSESLAEFRQKCEIPFSHTIWSAVFEARINRRQAEKEFNRTNSSSQNNKKTNKSNCTWYKNQRVIGTALDCKSCGKFVCNSCSYSTTFQRTIQCSANDMTVCCCMCAYNFDGDFLVI